MLNVSGRGRLYLQSRNPSEYGTAVGQNAATLSFGRPGVLHGAYTPLLQDEHGQVVETHSVSAGLDYPGVGPEHAWLRDTGRATYTAASDADALGMLFDLCAKEGILCAVESAHALDGARRYAEAHPGCVLVVLISGRGDKDLPILLAAEGRR